MAQRIAKPERFWLARHFNTSEHPDGRYRLEVEASDVSGNPRSAVLELRISNGG